eukprot:354820-Chlamydomonas_euryale.AAC.3
MGSLNSYRVGNGLQAAIWGCVWEAGCLAGVLHVCVTGLSGGMLEAGSSLGSSHLAGCMGACITEFYGGACGI